MAPRNGDIRTTVYHPFWVLNGRDLDERSTPRELSEREDQGFSLPGRWVNSHELRVGDVLCGQGGRQMVVLRITQEYKSGFPVNNLTIDEDHTFAVGPEAVLVHNTAGCPTTAASGVYQLHHAWPKYLGGPSQQDLVKLKKAVHDAYHSGLDKIFPRQWGKKYYDSLSRAPRRQLEQDLAAYTKAFDAKYGTNLWQSMRNNGFPGQ